MNYEELLTQTETQLSELTHDQLIEQSQQLLNCLLEQTTRNRENLLTSLSSHYNQTLTTPRRLLGETFNSNQ